MRKFIAILTVLFILLSLVACRKDKRDNSSTYEYVPSDTTSGELSETKDSGSKSDSKSGSTSKTNSLTKTDSSLKSNSSSKTNSSSKSNSTSSSASSSSKPSSNTSKKEARFRFINYKTNNNESFETTFDTYYWKMPYGREDDGTFTRDGYVLLGYSFDSNGGGQLIRPGYKYTLPTKDEYQNLYCVWAKETNPSYFNISKKSSTSVYITAYTGSDNVVYIPREINGMTVTGIASGAFRSNKSITEVHITSSVLVVEANAFASCSNLKTVTLYDNLKEISNTSFNGSSVKTVRMCAGKTPRYATSYETYGKKYERLTSTSGQKRIIVLAGSSALYGIDSDYMESLFKDNYKVVNFGTNASMNVPFYLDVILPHLTKNDIVIFAPEQYGPYAYHSNGNPELPSVNFQGISTCYNLLENIDISNYTNVFDSIGQYCSESARMPQLSWEEHSMDIDEFGDLAGLTNKMNSPNFRYGANGYFRFNNTVIPAEYIPNLNRIIDKVKNTGAKIFFSYPPHNRNNIEKSSLNDQSYDSYNSWISQTVHCTLISDIRDYIHNAEYFANTDYHLNAVGRKLHTKQLAEDIINAGIGVK